MTKDDIIRMARESECEETFGTDSFRFTIEDLERFTNLVVAADRATLIQQIRYWALENLDTELLSYLARLKN